MADLLLHLGPWMAASAMVVAVYSGNRQLPMMSDIAHLIVAKHIIAAVWRGLVRPAQQKFHVTEKGVRVTRPDASLLLPLAAFAVATGAGPILALGTGNTRTGDSGFWLVFFWTGINLLLLCLAIIGGIDKPLRRAEQRFRLSRDEVIINAPAGPFSARLIDVSMSGALEEISLQQAMPMVGEVFIDALGLVLPFRQSLIKGNRVVVQFMHDENSERALLLALFCPAHAPAVSKVKIIPSMRAAARQILH
ncbi:MAG: PilZ domain-containing protein [Acidocella sp.]|nr:PilZ domain-containing protein [Acidocella sp.]